MKVFEFIIEKLAYWSLSSLVSPSLLYFGKGTLILSNWFYLMALTNSEVAALGGKFKVSWVLESEYKEKT